MCDNIVTMSVVESRLHYCSVHRLTLIFIIQNTVVEGDRIAFSIIDGYKTKTRKKLQFGGTIKMPKIRSLKRYAIHETFGFVDLFLPPKRHASDISFIKLLLFLHR